MKRGIQSIILAKVLLLMVVLVCIFPLPIEGTGNLENEPTGGYSEGNEVFAITKNDFAQTATTSFATGETFRVNITSYLVDLQGNGQAVNNLYITNYLGALQGGPVGFTQQDIGGAHVYTQILQAPLTPDHYLVVARIEDDDGNEFETKDVIIVGGGTNPPKYIKTYSDSTYSTVDWTFTSIDTIYIEVYSEVAPNNARSSVSFADYNGGESLLLIKDLNLPMVTMNGDYARLKYDLARDLDPGDLRANALTEGYWYTLSVDLKKGNEDTIISDWTIQIQITDIIEPSLEVEDGATQADPPTVEREGNFVTTISAQFTDTDEPSSDSFVVTFKVRNPDNEEIIIVDRKTNGQSGEFGYTVSVTSSGGGVYTATIVFDPDNSFIMGDYDLYFKVEDGTGEIVEDGFHQNQNDLTITSATSPPEVHNGATQCIPDTIDKMGEHITMISTQFSDEDSLNVNDFMVLFKIRDPDGNEIVLVDNKTNGQAGELGGSLSITSSATGVFTASYIFDPDNSFQIGDYDLYFRVTDEYGNRDTDGFNSNGNELHIISSVAGPTVDHGSTMVIPDVVDKMGDGVTMISAQFEDLDSDFVTNFTVTFKIKDEKGNEYVIVDSAKNGEAGEYGGIVTITSSSPNEYSASYLFNPPSSLPNGNYSLYFRVEDEYGSFAEDGYADNEAELQIIGEKEEKPEDFPYYICIILAIIVVLLLILLAAAMRKKGEKEAPYTPPEETDQEMPSSPPESQPQGQDDQSPPPNDETRPSPPHSST